MHGVGAQRIMNRHGHEGNSGDETSLATVHMVSRKTEQNGDCPRESASRDCPCFAGFARNPKTGTDPSSLSRNRNFAFAQRLVPRSACVSPCFLHPVNGYQACLSVLLVCITTPVFAADLDAKVRDDLVSAFEVLAVAEDGVFSATHAGFWQYAIEHTSGEDQARAGLLSAYWAAAARQTGLARHTRQYVGAHGQRRGRRAGGPSRMNGSAL